MQSPPSSLEVKAIDTSHALSSSTLRDLQEDLMRTVTAFQQANDQRLREIEQKHTNDVLTLETVERLNARIDHSQKQIETLLIKTQRPEFSEKPPISPHGETEHKRAFTHYMRKGNAIDLATFEQKALSVGSGPDGGYLVPAETEGSINRLLSQISPMRQISDVRQVSVSTYKKPFATSGASTGWVGETALRPQTNTPTLKELQFPAAEIYAMPAATQTMLDDSIVDIDQWLAKEVQIAFATQEGDAFITGDGNNKPKGFLSATKVADNTWSFDNLGYLATGVSGAFPASNPSDSLISLIYTLKSGYRQNATFIMNRKTQAEVRKLKDQSGNYLWQPAEAASQRPTLLNFPIVEAEAMPTIAADSFAIAFGDFRAGYLIVDRIGMRILRDPYSAKPYVLFYTTKRVGGGVQNFEAIKLMKFGVS